MIQTQYSVFVLCSKLECHYQVYTRLDWSQTNVCQLNSMSFLIYLLWWAWDYFARLIHLECKKIFACSECGMKPQVIVCNATDVGIWKDLLLHITNDAHANTSAINMIKGNKHLDRIFFANASIRRLIRKLSGVQDKRRNRTKKGGVKATELKQLIRNLTKSDHPTTTEIISMQYSPRKLMAESFTSKYTELSWNSPVCGIFQVGTSKVNEVLGQVQDMLDVRQVENFAELTMLQCFCPVLANRTLFGRLFKIQGLPLQFPQQHHMQM